MLGYLATNDKYMSLLVIADWIALFTNSDEIYYSLEQDKKWIP